MMNIVNEEIRAIRHTMSHLQQAIPLETNSGRKEELKQLYKECELELEERLNRCGDYHG